MENIRTDIQFLFILVLFYNDEEVEKYISDELARQSLQNYHVLIVNNGSRSEISPENRFKSFSQVSVIGSGENLGYFGAADFAIRKYADSGKVPAPLTVISNTDLHFTDKDILKKLSEVEAAFDIAGPDIQSAVSGYKLNPFSAHPYSKAKLQFLKIVYSFYPFYLIYQTLSLLKRRLTGESNSFYEAEGREVAAIHGSFMMFRPSYFAKGGNFKMGSFLYCEELYVAGLAEENGMRTVFLPSVKLIHHEHATTGTFKSPKHIRFMKESVIYLLNRFFNERK